MTLASAPPAPSLPCSAVCRPAVGVAQVAACGGSGKDSGIDKLRSCRTACATSRSTTKSCSEERSTSVETLDANNDAKFDVKIHLRRASRAPSFAKISDLNHDGRPGSCSSTTTSQRASFAGARPTTTRAAPIDSPSRTIQGRQALREASSIRPGKHRIDTWEFYDAERRDRASRARHDQRRSHRPVDHLRRASTMTIAFDKNGDGHGRIRIRRPWS